MRRRFFPCVSIHAPRAERDGCRLILLVSQLSFNPRAPGGARLAALDNSHLSSACFNPRAPGGARPCQDLFQTSTLMVSIHAPRAERDLFRHCKPRIAPCFNPRAPGGARLGFFKSSGAFTSVSIHAPRAERDVYFISGDKGMIVSIHAPRAERDFG